MIPQKTCMIYVMGVYALLLAAGGTVGYLQARSLPSLCMGCFSAIWMLLCILSVQKQKTKKGWIGAAALCGLLSVFFSYRFSLNLKWMPSGMMMLVSYAVLTYLFFIRKKFLK